MADAAYDRQQLMVATNFVAQTGRAVSSSAVDAAFAQALAVATIATAAMQLGTDPTANTAAIQAAANAGGTILLPPGIWPINDRIVVSHAATHIRGAGTGVTVLQPVQGADLFYVIGNQVIEHLTISHLSIVWQGTPAAGAAIHTDGEVQNVIIEHVAITGAWIGMQLDQYDGYICRVANCLVKNCGGIGIATGTGAGFVQEIDISHTPIENCGIGLLIDNAYGVYADTVDVSSCTTVGIQVAPSAAGRVAGALQFTRVSGDSTAAGPGWLFSGPGAIGAVSLVNCWASGNVGDGVQINAAGLTGLTWAGGMIIDNHQHGLHLVAGKQVCLTGGTQVFANGYAAANTYDGVHIAAGSSGWSVTGNMIGGGGVSASGPLPAQQRYGVFIDPGASDDYLITGNRFTGNTAGRAVSDGGTAPTVGKLVTGNL